VRGALRRTLKILLPAFRKVYTAEPGFPDPNRADRQGEGRGEKKTE
jgi:hypothetical protein